jgi:hypothetical protein
MASVLAQEKIPTFQLARWRCGMGDRAMNKPEQPVKVFTPDDFPAELERLSHRYGGIAAMARRFGVDRVDLHKAIRGKRPPSPALLRQLNATKTLVYVVRVGGK